VLALRTALLSGLIAMVVGAVGASGMCSGPDGGHCMLYAGLLAAFVAVLLVGMKPMEGMPKR
jgi:hypothetical protein